MKNFIFFFLIIYITNGQDLVFSSELPIIVIDTENQIILNDPRITCNMGIIYTENQLNYITDPYNEYNGQITIEIRGVSSQDFPKKSYSLETQTASGENNNVSLLTMPAENDWILYGPYYDITMMRNGLTYELARSMGWYSPGFRYCELFINNDYKGVYLLVEKIKRDKNRVNISENNSKDITGGYIIQLNHLVSESVDVSEYWNSSYSDLHGQTLSFRYYYPKADDITVNQKIYIQNFIYDFETSLANSNSSSSSKGFKNWINMNSAIDFFLIQEFSKNIDAYRASTFFYKDKSSINDTIFFGPIWDFNFSYGATPFCEGDQYQGWQFETTCSQEASLFWFKHFLKDDEYVNLLNCRWNKLRNDAFSLESIFSIIDSLSNTINEAAIRDLEIWHSNSTVSDYLNQVSEFKSWITNRINWLDMHMPGTCEILSEEQATKSLLKKFDLLGRENINNKGFQLHIYDDGSVEKKYVIK